MTQKSDPENFCKILEGCLRVTQNDLTIINGVFRFSCFLTLLELVGRLEGLGPVMIIMIMMFVMIMDDHIDHDPG